MARKYRTLITIGGMSVGIGVIVFLVSLGYGLEHLIISRVATLKEMKQIDAIPAVESNIKLSDRTVNSLESIDGVVKVLPLISIAGKVSYRNSVTDIVVYGVQSDYLKESSIDPVDGRIFTSNHLSELSPQMEDLTSEVKEAVVNDVFLELLGISDKPIGEEFEIVIIPSEDMSENQDGQSSEKFVYQIIGVVKDIQAPVIYVPINNLREAGISYYSEVRVEVVNQDTVGDVRKKIEVLGLKTSSIGDTVSQIENMFSTLRAFLWLIGLFSLIVASLGMINTLTISLLEKIREIGFMKALGMKSEEIQQLFLTESVVMSIFGGIGGLTLGVVLGKLLSLGLSFMAISRGFGPIDITSSPFSFVVVLLFVTVSIGILTGIYPAQRSQKISALEALRYE